MLAIRREGQSEFVDTLSVSKRGNVFVKTASKQAANDGVESKDDAKSMLEKFDKSEDIPDEYIQEHHDRLEKGHDPKEVTTDFFKGLNKAKASNKLTIRTAKIFRQSGIFKKADRDVYQDTQTGDYWKISDDKKSVIRLFKEVDGVATGV